MDYSELPYEPDDQTIDSALQTISYQKESQAKDIIQKIGNAPNVEIANKIEEALKHIQEAGKNQLVHHVVLRKFVLQFLANLLKFQENRKPHLEADIHKLIFPMNSNSEIANYDNHNLWILDERLNFTELVMSDQPIDKVGGNIPDLIIAHKLFDTKMAYRGGNDISNPITIFEFKKPLRDDFANESSKEDPILQIIRYRNKMKDGNGVTPEGRPIIVDDNTPFYGFVICDFNEKVRKWLERDKNFIEMPDKQGYYYYYSNIRLYIEVMSWDKVVKDAEMRNKIFFKKLGLE